MDGIPAAMDGFINLARVIGSTVDADLAEIFTKNIKGIEDGIALIQKSKEQLIREPDNKQVYQQGFLEGYRVMAQSMGDLLKAQGSSFQEKVQRGAQTAIDSVRNLIKAMQQPDDVLLAAAGANKDATVKLLRIVDQTVENTDNADRKALIGEAQASLKESSPKLFVAIQQMRQAHSTDPKEVLAAAAVVIKAINSITDAVTKSFRPPPVEAVRPEKLAGMGLEAAASFTDSWMKEAQKGALRGEDLIIASAEAARLAQELAKIAEAHAMTISDLALRAKILAAKTDVERLAAELLAAQKYAAANPNDAAAQVSHF
eukprot:TRINITY_DN6060_c0_g1_i1.p1 TRINITY_DN6060_c0_g1~~TRINITY_DN6060_c0_g1_i1.p1  ORF type:complete len:354 (-),score=103.65 TRINITY_DN6060_c0_g1_i1:66-1013(-)